MRGRGEEQRAVSRRDFLKAGGTGLVGVALLGAAGCGGGKKIQGGAGGQQASGGASSKNVLVYGRGADSVSLDPINATDGESFRVTTQVFDSLLAFAPGTTDVIPWLAVEVPKPENGGRLYTFKLRKGVKFHDGTDFNADAVVFNFDRWRDTKNPYHKGGGGQSSNFAYYSSQFGGFDEKSIIEKVEAVDPYTVRFTLREPQGPFLRNIAMHQFAIASPTAIKKDVENFWQHPVGTGPFKFVSWNRGSEVDLKKNPDWWGKDYPVSKGGGGPKVDKLAIRSIPDNTSRVAALSGGQLSIADGLNPDDVPTLKKNGSLKVILRPPLDIGYLAMNLQKKPFDKREVRQAVNMAINMPKIVEAFFGSTGEQASTYIPPTVPYFDKSIKPYPYSPARAKKLLARAGLAGGFKTELWYMPIPRPYMPDGKGIAQAMQSDLKKVGINAKLVTYEWGTYLQKTSSGQHDMCLLGWTGDNGDPDNFLNVLLSSSSATPKDALNVAYYKNPEVDRLLKTGQQSIDPAVRRRVYYKAQEILHQDAPWAPIAYAKPPIGARKDVSGYRPSPTGSEALNTVSL
ncbi:ABC transporter substrate-binding protein [Rubrobacter calidifluminis]|uniref:ABC transporter substrate-binding protein n=1 Tax=Rubrobacter calidifluminis TaxID=1392640 RepID=UPI002360B116|nr:ABC transporter substrate-binding protein [Rubrobacter calidifluminis]